MQIDQAIATAVEAGWSDDSRWTPKFITASLSREHNGLLAAAAVYADGRITWSSAPAPDAPKAPSRRGTAATLAGALAAALGSAEAVTTTLF